MNINIINDINTLSFIKVESRPPTLKSFSERCSSFIACVVTEGIRVSETKHLLDRFVPLSPTLAHLNRVKKVTLSTNPSQIVWHLLVCLENEFISRMACETASSTPSLSTRSTPSTTDEEHVNDNILKTTSCFTSSVSSFISSDREHPSFLTSLVNESGSNTILRSLSRLAVGGFFKTSVCVVPNPIKEEFKQESESSWPMMWFVPKGTQPFSLSKTICPSPPYSETSLSLSDKAISAVDHAYFLWGLRRAFQCTKSTDSNSIDIRGCIIARQMRSITKGSDKADQECINDTVLPFSVDEVAEPISEHIVEGFGSSNVSLEGGIGGGFIVFGFDPTQTAVMRAIDCVAATHRKREADSSVGTYCPSRSLPSSRGRGGSETIDNVSVGVKRQRESTSGSAVSLLPFSQRESAPAQQYICTGLDAFLTHEPDLFDAMALLHSRVARVIYGFPDDIAGAIGGVEDDDVAVDVPPTVSDSVHKSQKERPRLRLQEVRALNHHYSVYRMSCR